MRSVSPSQVVSVIFLPLSPSFSTCFQMYQSIFQLFSIYHAALRQSVLEGISILKRSDRTSRVQRSINRILFILIGLCSQHSLSIFPFPVLLDILAFLSFNMIVFDIQIPTRTLTCSRVRVCVGVISLLLFLLLEIPILFICRVITNQFTFFPCFPIFF